MYFFVKRLIDIIASLIGGILTFPVWFCIAVAVRLDSKGPILFRQKRVGAHKKYFQILKFRTMRIDTPHDMPTHLLTNPDQWLTRVGKILRKTSLDELPQIWNVLVGDMSLVGPRPALWNQYDLIEARDRQVGKYGMTANDVRPGITGWAQIIGRDELSIEEKSRRDGEYVQTMSLKMDAICFFGTIRSVFRQEGVVEGGAERLRADVMNRVDPKREHRE